ncbi:targeting protein for Xklp2 isoform X1 [Electrophorus electricus]|uniref:TPX2 microtubule nucleation factor n=2 Tax=Electrophorus electricus TaxID=8005 RepID=A0A4W4ECN8_ELEEL|nr:targeting protein for Xklp2 isoform X1 [Electrophorus electricus]
MDVQQPAESSDPYAYDAPSYVMNFDLDPEDNADHWFDLMAEPKSGEAEHLTAPLRVSKPFDGAHNENLPKAVVSPMVKAETVITDNTATEPPSNIVTSWGTSKPATGPGRGHKRNVPAQPRRVSKRPVVKNEQHQPPSTPPVKKRRSSKGPRSARRNSVSNRRSTRKNKPSVASATASASTASVNQHMSTEQQEMERIEALQKEVAEQRRRNEASYRAALAGSQPPKKQVLSTTIPKEFTFCSDSRLKNQNDVSDASYKEIDFTSQLRKHPASPLKAPKGTTVPKPFNLSTGSKRRLEDTDTYVSVAQQIEQFQKRTPVRYHLRSRQSQEKGPSPVKSGKLKVTHPHTPQLLTRQRSRPAIVKSAAEIEAEELEKMQQFKFKALELNRKILEGALAPKKPAPKEVTQPQGFQLEVEKRLHDRHSSKNPEEPEKHTFHSRPLPTRILEEVVGVPEKKVLNPTVPESPAFALKNRVRVERKTEEVKPPAPLKALPVPHYLPFHPKPAVKSSVEVCPFSFEQREQERKAQKEKRLEEVKNEEVPQFKARPLPDFHEVSLPEKRVIEPTKLAPFKLIIDERGSVKSERWERMIKEELKQQAEAACFKARPNTSTHKEPFVPKKENHSVLANAALSAVPGGFQLATERRAQERLEFERALKEKETLRAQMEEQQAREQEESEKEDIVRLRKEQVHKAQPVRRYKPIELKHSEATLTVPQSPKFSDRFRM